MPPEDEISINYRTPFSSGSYTLASSKPHMPSTWVYWIGSGEDQFERGRKHALEESIAEANNRLRQQPDGMLELFRNWLVKQLET